MTKRYEYLDDYTIGEKFISAERTITEVDIVTFAGLTDDCHPLHMDAEYAEKTPFGGRIAHGMMTLSIGIVLPFRFGQGPTFLPKSFIAFYGMDEVRFTSPTKIGDTIHCEAEIIGISDKTKGKGVLTMKSMIKNQRDEAVISSIIKIFCEKRKIIRNDVDSPAS